MAGTRTAPAFTAAANLRRITLHLIDTSGDLWTDEMYVPVAATAATIEAWAAAYQADTQSSLYKITDELVRSGASLASNGDTGFRAGGESGINIIYKNPTTAETLPTRLVSPVVSTMAGDSDTPDQAGFQDLIDAVVAIKTGFVYYSAQYTTRRERKNNTKIKG